MGGHGRRPYPATVRPGRSAPGERDDLLGLKLGRLIHVLIRELLVSGVRELDAEALFGFVGRHELVLREPASDRQSLKQHVVTACASYFRFFVPPGSWRLVGVEVSGPGCRFDVVWETDNGEIVVDEVKAGRLQTRPEREAVEEQLARELAAGTKKWGTRFSGIRLLWLGAPLHSVLVQPDGTRTPIYEGE
jgi:hypothetical protein